ALAAAPNAPDWLSLALAHEHAGRFARARECFAAACEMSPSPEAQAGLARATREVERDETARFALAEAVRLDQEHLELRSGEAPGVPRYYGIAKACAARRLYRDVIDRLD